MKHRRFFRDVAFAAGGIVGVAARPPALAFARGMPPDASSSGTSTRSEVIKKLEEIKRLREENRPQMKTNEQE